MKMLIPSVEETLESFLVHPEHLPIHDTSSNATFWDRDPHPLNVLQTDLGPLTTTLQFSRDLRTGEITGFSEVPLEEAGCTSKNSTSMLRAPGPPDESIKGSASNYPFWPGGFDDFNLVSSDQMSSTIDIDEQLDNPANYLHCPPGFSHGVDFHSQSGGGPQEESNLVNLASILTLDQDQDDHLGIWKSEPLKQKTKEKKSHLDDDEDGADDDELNLLVSDVVKIGSQESGKLVQDKSTQWAEMVDISQPMLDFHQKVPIMAFTWPFELDNFQKQAVLRLERNESVFVAAHTSAGKTVVAEYAIALSQKHMTRTIYTSPIKALSNQKFRDFKDTFTDVGLVTGDIQINPSATCLIMTTEILRSMLYNGSDIIRDLEYVIFDEVHYINDPDRGVVWEEVLILLPQHVNIIMLSATVSNTIVFADWVGRTKKKKIHVISTLKRPVPLEHYLYTGSDGKSKDEMFLLQDASGKFLVAGHAKAEAAKKAREKTGKQQYGAKGKRDKVGVMQEKNIWLTLVDHLQRKDKLPVVAFTLSRNRCDRNASLLTSLDLTTTLEKSDIKHFIRKCTQRLKGTDQKLPQVVQLTELLQRGIGIHHSGVLPILKEVVEMLFQKGWVKLLFATETFAMGVNMPARTVVFDNIRKHDGTAFRTLKPAEYIQMAGRAGRRGLDSTGTVIILCKDEVYDMSELSRMMQGQPANLTSQFKLTYSMILNLLRVEQLRVEDMMKRSFREIDSQKSQGANQERLAEIKEAIEKLPVSIGPLDQQLDEFYQVATKFFAMKKQHWTLILSQQVPSKAMVPGRLLVVNKANLVNQIVVLLSVDRKSSTFTVLMLNDENEDPKEIHNKIHMYYGVADGKPGIPGGLSSTHSMVEVKDEAIVDITCKVIKCDPDKVKNDVKRREIARFRDDPPGPTTAAVLEDLVKYATNSEEAIEVMNWVKDFRIQDMDLLDSVHQLHSLRARISEMQVCKTSEFRSQFVRVYNKRTLQDELEHTEYLLSERRLQFMPDYHKMLDVLRQLKYIDDNNTVQLKGRVACEMGSNELLMTELLFHNILTDRHPAEIAALLSCMVFQQKNCSEPELTPSLEQGVETIKKYADMIGQMQKSCGLDKTAEEYVDQYHFGLVQVTHEWARGMPFALITGLTDVQEGVIVRTIQRLDETLRDVKDAARVIGDPMLYQKMDEASTIIKRDIVFAASLYTQ